MPDEPIDILALADDPDVTSDDLLAALNHNRAHLYHQPETDIT